MRIAILSDIHGNSVALDAVLADIAAQGSVDADSWLAGDLVALGPDPVGVIQRLRASIDHQAVRGNTDCWLVDVHTELPFSLLDTLHKIPVICPDPLAPAYGMTWAQGAVNGQW